MVDNCYMLFYTVYRKGGSDFMYVLSKKYPKGYIKDISYSYSCGNIDFI